MMYFRHVYPGKTHVKNTRLVSYMRTCTISVNLFMVVTRITTGELSQKECSKAKAIYVQLDRY